MPLGTTREFSQKFACLNKMLTGYFTNWWGNLNGQSQILFFNLNPKIAIISRDYFNSSKQFKMRD